MAKPGKTTFVCQNCGAVSPRWAGKCASCGEWNTIVEEARRVAAAGLGPQRAERSGRAVVLERLQGASRRGAALLDRHRRARPRHRRRHRAGLGAADRRRARHRQIDAAAAARGVARPLRAARHLFLRRGSGGAGAAARRAARARASAPSRSPARPTSPTSSRRSKPRSPPTSSSSIPSRRCGPTRSKRRRAPSARCAPRRSRWSATPRAPAARCCSSAT